MNRMLMSIDEKTPLQWINIDTRAFEPRAAHI